MATDVDVQYFSHLNGLTLGNNWGDLIRLLDTCLVNGLPLASITSASIDAQGDITLNLYAAHNCQLFQIVELTGFNAVSLGNETRQVNGKYRIKGVPSANQLILKGVARTDTNPTAVNLISIGTAKLSSLGYEIIFRDAADVKRVYRAKNPTLEHPFIRVDESLTSQDGVSGVYTSSYAKYAMVGLLEKMSHIDDYESTDVQQLPFNPATPSKNWNIAGTGSNVIRGWSKWYWATGNTNGGYFYENSGTLNGGRSFTLCGDSNAFYFMPSINTLIPKPLFGCGIFKNALNSLNQPWFLMSCLTNQIASSTVQIGATPGLSALTISASNSVFWTTRVGTNLTHSTATPIVTDYLSGSSGIYGANDVAALEVPFNDSEKYLRGTLPIVNYMGKTTQTSGTTPVIADNSMYVTDNVRHTSGNITNAATLGGGVYFYLGELE